MTAHHLVNMLYCRDDRLRAWLEGLLAGLALEATTSRAALWTPALRPCAIIYGVTECSEADVQWLRLATRRNLPSPPCVAVAPLSVQCLRRLSPLRSRGLRIVWAEEAEDCLFRVVSEIDRDGGDPLWRLGWRLLSGYPLRPAVREAITRTCGLDGNSLDRPRNSVRELSDHVRLSARALSRYWGEDVPLRCRLKEFLDWAVLLRAVRAPPRESWDAVARDSGVHRRTLERKCARLTGSTLAAVRRDPERASKRFREWHEAAWKR